MTPLSHTTTHLLAIGIGQACAMTGLAIYISANVTSRHEQTRTTWTG